MHVNISASNIEFVTYALVGVVTAALYFGISYFFIRVVGIDYQLAVSIAYIVAVCFHFFANWRVTFLCENHNLFIHAKRYLAMLIINYVAMFLILNFLVENMEVESYIASAVSVFVVVLLGFVLSKLWVFSAKGLKKHV